jgi:short-subunit dehydrogenase
METKAIVITGASSGIGRSLAIHLAGQGHRLALAARRSSELERVAAEANGALAVVADVTRRSDVERLRDTALASLGSIDVWINNVGRGISRPLLDITDADVDEMVTVNLKSALYGMQAIVPHFQARGRGHIINVSSFLGKVPLAAPRAMYSAVKSALNSLTASLRTDLARDFPEIHVSLVLPGVVTTDFAKNALGGGPPTSVTAARFPGVPLPQTPEEVAAAIAALLEKPQAELFTNPPMAAMALRYATDVEAFERGLRG